LSTELEDALNRARILEPDERLEPSESEREEIPVGETRILAKLQG